MGNKYFSSRHNSEFESQGFTTVHGVVDPGLLDDILENMVRVLWRLSPESKRFSLADKPWNSKEFHAYLSEFRKIDPGRFSALYDSAQSSIGLKRLIADRSLVESVAGVLGVSLGDLSTSGEQVRMDPPFDTRNSYGWHQERSYYPVNRESQNGLVCWIPLLDVSQKQGPLEICPGSQKEDFYPVFKTKKEEQGSEQFEVPKELVEKYTASSHPISRGSILLSHLLLFHRSGTNTSHCFRFSVIGRYHVATADDFLPFRKLGSYNRFMMQHFREKGDLLRDIRYLYPEEFKNEI